MLGPQILARTLSCATSRGKSTRQWQYHSRSDNHSKAACWAILFDLLHECSIFREQAEKGKIGFAVNHVMIGKLNKTLDLVVCAIPPTRHGGVRRSFADLVNVYGIQLSDTERNILATFPPILEERSDDVSEVLIAVEAKACMTEHGKAIPRLFAEILATGYLAKQAAPRSITVSYTVVNAAEKFITPSGSAPTNVHNQPRDAQAVVDMLSSAIPTSSSFPSFGYDAVGVTVVSCHNDGSPVTLLDTPPAPGVNRFFHYDRMMRTLCAEFRSRFSSL